MKQAAGEANMTVITIVLIGVVASLGLVLIPRLMESVSMRSACNQLGGNLSGTICTYKVSDEINTCTIGKCADGHYACYGKCDSM